MCQAGRPLEAAVIRELDWLIQGDTWPDVGRAEADAAEAEAPRDH